MNYAVKTSAKLAMDALERAGFLGTKDLKLQKASPSIYLDLLEKVDSSDLLYTLEKQEQRFEVSLKYKATGFKDPIAVGINFIYDPDAEAQSLWVDNIKLEHGKTKTIHDVGYQRPLRSLDNYWADWKMRHNLHVVQQPLKREPSLDFRKPALKHLFREISPAKKQQRKR
jgi:hypothetical protein